LGESVIAKYVWEAKFPISKKFLGLEVEFPMPRKLWRAKCKTNTTKKY
jgi:hypothetical protein